MSWSTQSTANTLGSNTVLAHGDTLNLPLLPAADGIAALAAGLRAPRPVAPSLSLSMDISSPSRGDGGLRTRLRPVPLPGLAAVALVLDRTELTGRPRLPEGAITAAGAAPLLLEAWAGEAVLTRPPTTAAAAGAAAAGDAVSTRRCRLRDREGDEPGDTAAAEPAAAEREDGEDSSALLLAPPRPVLAHINQA